MSKTRYFFKFLSNNRTGGYTEYRWPGKGVWTKRLVGSLRLCKYGYHVLRPRDLHYWYTPNKRLFLVECETDDMKMGINKVVVRRARIVREIPYALKNLFFKRTIKNWMKENGLDLIE